MIFFISLNMLVDDFPSDVAKTIHRTNQPHNSAQSGFRKMILWIFADLFHKFI